MGRSLLFIVLAGLLTGCPGGGDGGGGTATATGGTTVSGSVQAPNGQVAFEQRPGVIHQLAHLFTPTAYASISGLSAVPDGTPVQLARFNATGTSLTALSTTTTSGGRYSFNLANLGVQFSNDLIVQVTGSTGKMLRAFVTNSITDVDPGSELAVRLVLEQMASAPGTTFTNLTLKEVTDLSAAVKLLTSTKQLAGGMDLETTVATVRNAVLAQPEIVAFINDAMAAGQTTLGPGDVGNYFPMTQGNAWSFQGIHTETNQPTINFQNTLAIAGTTLVDGITATVRSESNPQGSGTPENDYVTKETDGITFRGNNDPTDHTTPQIVPYRELRFPLQAGTSYQSVTRSGFDFGQDVDGDGRNETANVTSQVTVIGFETVTVPAGTFTNTAQVQSQITLTVILSKSGSAVTIGGTQTLWLAPGIGPVKEQQVIQGQGVTETTSEELVSYLVNGQGAGSVPLTIASAVSQANSDTTDPGPTGIASDGNNYLVVFCQDLAASPGLYGKFTTGGTGQPFFIATRTCASNNGIGVAYDGTNYFVAYSQNGMIQGVRISSSGIILDGSGGFPISTGIPFVTTNYAPAVAFDGTNYLVVWAKFIGVGYDIYGARVTPNGQVLGEFPISTASGEQVEPSLVFDGAQYFVVWRDTRTGSGPTTDTHIYGTRVSTGGTVLDPTGMAIVTAPGPQGEPAIAFDGTNYLVVWSNGGQAAFPQSPITIYGKRVKPDGSLLDGTADSLGIPISTTSLSKSSATVTFDGTNYLAVWIVTAFPRNAPPNGVYGAKVSTGGQVLNNQTNPDGILLNGPSQNSDAVFAYPVAHSNQSNTLLTWTSIRELQGATKSILGLLIFP